MISIGDGRLDVWQSRSDNSAVIVCRGWLDTETCDRLQELIDAALDEHVERLRLDLSNLLGLDDSGQRCLARTSFRCERDGVLLEVDGNRPILRAIREWGVADGSLQREG